MPIKERWKVEIPDGYRILEREFAISGIQHYKDEFFKIVKKGNMSFGMKQDTKNKYDSNAIKVTASRKGFFGKKEATIGFIPAEMAGQISDAKVFDDLIMRPKAVYIGDDGYIDFKVDLLVKKESFEKYENV
ncbi:MAG: hypothetical protein JKY50_09830 [Oleispira sp.]|nr:hypothetical protein [Oleispira sp.]MBL4880678.1 hypothetical protein [Oleispira sp.]